MIRAPLERASYTIYLLYAYISLVFERVYNMDRLQLVGHLYGSTLSNGGCRLTVSVAAIACRQCANLELKLCTW